MNPFKFPPFTNEIHEYYKQQAKYTASNLFPIEEEPDLRDEDRPVEGKNMVNF